MATYRSDAHGYDEAVDGQGLRPHWKAVIQQLDAMGVDLFSQRWLQSQRQMQSEGAAFQWESLPNESSRPWTLGAIPVIFSEQQWQAITAGVAQRARLYEFILQDLYGPQRLLQEQLLPPECLFAHPNYFPAYHGLIRPDEFYLQLFASDIARGSDGAWQVTGDRTRAPFGLGYLLENRIVMSRQLPVAFRKCRVQRLALFFKTMRETLQQQARHNRDNPRIALWTRGPASPAYFEDSYLARYLGYTLAEGDDLAVRENRVMLKSLGGLLPIEVLLRRIDDDDADPVELASDSISGVSGLVEVMRSENVAMANGLGSRLVESPVFLPFLETIASRCLGEKLLLNSIRTWWCGDATQRQYVFDHFDEVLIRPAYRTYDAPATNPTDLTHKERDELRQSIEQQPTHYVGQAKILRSTTPVWNDGHLQPWSLAIRNFVVRNREGFYPLPGGLARVARDPNSLEQTMTSGEQCQDVWVLSAKPVEEITLLPQRSQRLVLRRSTDDLPSRVADNLYWLGRNLERTEGQARLLRTALLRLTDERERVPEMPMVLRGLAEYGCIEPDYAIEELRERLPELTDVLPRAVYDDHQTMGLRHAVRETVRIASTVRDRVAIDLWRTIRRMDDTTRMPEGVLRWDASESLVVLNRLITELVAVSGLAAESMTRTQGWRFFDFGRRLERAWQTSTLCLAMLCHEHSEESNILEAFLATVDSLMTYRSRYLASVQVAPVIDLAILDETNPRSIAYQLAKLNKHVERLPRDATQVQRSTEQRIAINLFSIVRLADAYELERTDRNGERTSLTRLMEKLLENLPRLSDAVSSRFLIHAGLQRHFAVNQGDGL